MSGLPRRHSDSIVGDGMRIERHVVFWLAALAVLLGLLALLREVLLPFVAGMVIAYFLNPIADRLERIGLGRSFAAALVVLAVGLLLVTAAVLVIPLLIGQLKQLAETLPTDLDRLKDAVEAWLDQALGARFPGIGKSVDRALADLGASITASAGAIARTAWAQGLAIANLVSILLITPVVVFYLLVDWHPMLARIDGWLPRRHADTIRRLACDINAAVSAFIRGQGTICIILGLFYALALTFAGLPYGALIGLATGVLAFIPFVGWGLGLVVAVGIALAHTWPAMLLAGAVVAIFAAGMAIDSAVLSPKIVGAKIGLHPVWLMLALFVFSYLFGFVGMLLAVPVAAAVGVLVRHALQLYLASDIYAGPGGTAGSPTDGKGPPT